MRAFFVFISLIGSLTLAKAQSHEIGVFLGGSNYVGDIGRTNYIYPNKFAGGIVYKYNLNPRIALRGNYNYLPISGDNRNAENPFRQTPNNIVRRFTNTIHEFAAGVEFNFYEYNISDYRTTFTPYILAQFAAINYKSPVRFISPNSIELANRFSFAIPLGIGIKGRLDDNLAFALESSARITFVDDLDYTTTKIPIINNVGNGNDWYFFTGLSIVYTFGRPPCYNGLTD
ncbi:hypothetical protein WH52_14335 [Tenacibaculum holothuriorum]|uniref:DUF6089 domain-containing protein n=1 Tax=Tenacibaculum holothuriorum TaxID=1635173 RepID=A0A1Y2P8R6_9FLAO|nr:DUF6089 family protein [Tenacibaculum holothuriorum]OSY86855.1 hypothetical protein WH52_14335 [Tenacibaculum holothuriorum]